MKELLKKQQELIKNLQQNTTIILKEFEKVRLEFHHCIVKQNSSRMNLWYIQDLLEGVLEGIQQTNCDKEDLEKALLKIQELIKGVLNDK